MMLRIMEDVRSINFPIYTHRSCLYTAHLGHMALHHNERSTNVAHTQTHTDPHMHPRKYTQYLKTGCNCKAAYYFHSMLVCYFLLVQVVYM